MRIFSRIISYTFLVSLPQLGFDQNFIEIGESLGIDYSFVTEEYGGGVSFVDFNQDGLDDLTFATSAGIPIQFHQNTGSGYLLIDSPIEQLEEVKQVLWVDFNNDGYLDLYISSIAQNKLYKNLGNFTFQDVTSSANLSQPEEISYGATWFDYDQDGYIDLFSTYRTKDTTGAVLLYRNLGNETFEERTITAGLWKKGNSVLALTSFDYNNDGFTDLFLGQDWEQGNQLLKNNGNGTFTDVSEQAKVNQRMNSMTATVGDYNMDGWLDIYVSNTTEGNILLKNNSDGTFSDVSADMKVNIRALTFGSAFFDADNDGDLELQVVGFQSNYLFENSTPGQPYQRVDQDWGFESDKYFNNGLALGDYDNNGSIDLVRNSVTLEDHVTGKNTFYKNNFSSNNFLKVELIGTVSNRYAVGSRLTLYNEGQKLIRRIGLGESFGSQHSFIQHFGMGRSVIADSLIVLWPNGNQTKVTNIEANQLLTLTEPSTGCTDQNACNYHSNALEENGSCRYSTLYMDCQGCINDSDLDGICDELEVFGCTDQLSCTYNPLATEDDGSCSYLPSQQITGPTQAPPLIAQQYSYPSKSGSNYMWSITNGSIAFGQGNHLIQVFWHDGESNGNLKVVETDLEGCQSLPVNLDVMIGLNPLISNQPNSIEVYPNPASNYLFITRNSDEPVEISLLNMSGIKVFSFSNDINLPLDVAHLPEGIYMLQLKESTGLYQQKIRIYH